MHLEFGFDSRPAAKYKNLKIIMEQINYCLSYSSRDDDTRDTIMDLDVSFENPTDEVLKSRINTWLRAIGVDLEVVSSTVK
jgi:hypothetical protein